MKEKNLKEKTITGLYWSFVDILANQFIHFFLGIILARLLTPREYGLTGMIAVFLAISNVFIISGFGEALVRKKDPTQADHSTVFLFNVIVSIGCYSLLVLCSGSISAFFNEPMLQKIVNIFLMKLNGRKLHSPSTVQLVLMAVSS